MTHIGIFKWYDEEKGFGVISSLIVHQRYTEQVFCHHKNIKNLKSYASPVSFDVKDRSKGGKEAVHCKPFSGKKEEWRFLFENIKYNLDVEVDSMKKNVLTAALKMISNRKEALNFIDIYKETEDGGLTLDTQTFSQALAYTNISELQDFIVEKTRDIPSEKKKELFQKRIIGLYTLSDEECLESTEYIEQSDYNLILRNRPNIVKNIIEKKINDYIQKFPFLQKETSITGRSSLHVLNHDTINKLYSDYVSYGNQIQFFDDSNNTLGSNIEKSIVLLKDDLCKSITLIQNTHPSNLSIIKDILDFPECFTPGLKNYLLKISDQHIKSTFNFAQIVECMQKGILDIELSYIFNNIKKGNSQIVEFIIKHKETFSSEFAINILFQYLYSSNDIEGVVSCYNSNYDIQSTQLTEKLKEHISSNYSKSGKFMESVSKYTNLLGEQYVYQISTQFLLDTHNAGAIFEQVINASEPYKTSITHYLCSFHMEYPSKIDDCFMESFYNKYLLPRSFNVENLVFGDEYHINLITTYINTTNNHRGAMSYANKLKGKVKCHIEELLITSLSKTDYMHLWEDELCETLPDGYLCQYLDDKEYKYERLDKWIRYHRVEEDDIQNTFTKILQFLRGQKNHKWFKTEFLIYRYVNKKNWQHIYEGGFNKCHTTLFEWALNPSYKSFNEIAQIFLLFPESIQVKLLKFIFLNIKEGSYSVNIQDLELLNHCDPEYQTSLDKPTMSLSVAVVIDYLCSVPQKENLYSDKRLYTLFYNSFSSDRHMEISPISHFFDKCTGKKKRFYPNPNTIIRFIFPIRNKSNEKWYIIHCENENSYSTYNEGKDNDDNYVCDNYDYIEMLNSIDEIKYHPKHKVWFTSEENIDLINNIVEYNNFVLINKELPLESINDSFHTIIQHFSQEEVKAILRSQSELNEWKEPMPKILFCEGRESQKGEADVWWCVGKNPCNDLAIQLHESDEWEKFTLFDFCSILGFELDERNKYGNFKVGKYALLITSINRFNNLLERLHCKRCDEILFPVESNYSEYGASNFWCTNPQCQLFHNRIYLNHCYTKKCRGIIDSREANRCPNGLVICKECGTCCSNEMFKSRLDKLQRVGSKVSTSDLIYKLENNLGHREKQEYFCFKCGNALSESDIKDKYCAYCGIPIEYIKHQIKIKKN